MRLDLGAAEARAVAAVLFSGVDRRDLPQNQAWRRMATDLVAACILHYRNLGAALAARRQVARLIKALLRSQAPDVAELVAGLRNLATQKPHLARKLVTTALDTGLTLWAERTGHVREISSDTSLDVAYQLLGVPTVLILSGSKWRKSTHGPYLGALLQALTGHLRRTIQQQGPGRLPVGLILSEFPELGRLGFLVGETEPIHTPPLSVLVTTRTLARLDPIYPDPEERDRLIANLGTRILFGGCDAPTAEVGSRWGQGLILPKDLTGLGLDHAVLFAHDGQDQAEPVILHGKLQSFRERADWHPARGAHQDFTVISRPMAPHSASRSTHEGPSSSGDGQGQESEHDPIEQSLRDISRPAKRKERDLWTDDNW